MPIAYVDYLFIRIFAFPKAVEVTQIAYEPTQMDILYAEGITSSNGVASMEFSFPKSSDDWYMESTDQKDPEIRFAT